MGKHARDGEMLEMKMVVVAVSMLRIGFWILTDDCLIIPTYIYIYMHKIWSSLYWYTIRIVYWEISSEIRGGTGEPRPHFHNRARLILLASVGSDLALSPRGLVRAT